ncbi:thiamine pyrophosphate-binding protein [Mangrovivirga sp. M17]|uniref:Thiamine pyrophosphate-binding protein n=1 Tax=Mangrovivirga halotolerans TaxID=2993936 RepID=A0ABT3RVF3_9BACT|nr:thiamine pyrophosphate-dependent enzyme [Mangrovivirga halotolerans]MCX2745344.1 thiamine pyrophosphate-binding protein [Mangrovivirga halotolerans]
MTVSEQLLGILSNEGVKHIFGVAGDALNPLVCAIGSQDKVKWIKVKHEGNGAFAAFAQGELNDKLGVCASTVGPGALHLINGLYNAKKERSPVLAITGQIPVEYIGTNFHQEVDLKNMFNDVCDYQAIIRSPEEAPRIFIRAMRTAINNKAVCRVELPADIAEMEAKNNYFIQDVFVSDSIVIPPESTIDQAAKLINEEDKIGILAGTGCRDARDEVLKFASKIKAPITHTVRSSDIFDHEAPGVVGLSGLIGNSAGYDGIMECDLLIMLGTDFPYFDFLPKNKKIIQIDIRPESIGNRAPVDLGIHGDVKYVVGELLEKCTDKTDDSFRKKLVKSFTSWKESNLKKSDPKGKLSLVQASAVSKGLSDIASDDAVFVVDTGTSTIWSTNFMNFKKERRMIGSFNHGSMAVGLPAAIGAQLEYPDREIWAMVGDGSFHMTLHEFSTAVEYNLPIKIIVFNNAELGFVKIEMEEAGLAPNYDALAIKNFDFQKFAEVTGGKGFTIDKPDKIIPVLKEARATNGPCIINAIVEPGELSLPPKIGFEEAKNFGTSKIKEALQSVKGDKRQWENIKSEINAFIDKEINGRKE